MSFTLVGDDLDGITRVLPRDATRNGQRIEFTTADPTRDVHAITGWAIEHGVPLDALSVSRPTLEDVFLGLADAGVDGDADGEERP